MIVVDVETTGTYAHKHSMVSIGAIEFENPDNHFYGECYVDDDVAIEEEALQINGFTMEQLKDRTKQSLKELAQAFLDWSANIEDKTLGGHNTYFDAAFLRAAVVKLKKQPSDRIWPFGRRYVDMHSIAFAIAKRVNQPIPLKYGFSAFWSGGVYEFCGLPMEPEPHHGLTGAKMEAEAMSRLIHGKVLLPEYEGYPLPDYLKRQK